MRCAQLVHAETRLQTACAQAVVSSGWRPREARDNMLEEMAAYAPALLFYTNIYFIGGLWLQWGPNPRGGRPANLDTYTVVQDDLATLLLLSWH